VQSVTATPHTLRPSPALREGVRRAGAGEARSRATWGGIATGGAAAMHGGLRHHGSEPTRHDVAVSASAAYAEPRRRMTAAVPGTSTRCLEEWYTGEAADN
jgi:hypothetical protein